MAYTHPSMHAWRTTSICRIRSAAKISSLIHAKATSTMRLPSHHKSSALVAPTRRVTPRRTRLRSETQIDNLERSWNISRGPGAERALPGVRPRDDFGAACAKASPGCGP